MASGGQYAQTYRQQAQALRGHHLATVSLGGREGIHSAPRHEGRTGFHPAD
jgi:hypothetical protein